MCEGKPVYGAAQPMPTPLLWNQPGLLWDTPGVLWNGTAATPNPMPNDNRVSAEITAANLTAILTKIAEIKALLPFLLNLTKDERIQLPKLGPASLAFDEAVAQYMASAPTLIPPFVSAAEVAKDRALRLQLATIWRELSKLCEMVDDTRMLVGSEIWLAALSYYQMARQAAKRDVPGADTVYDDLKQRFPGVAGDTEEEPDPAPGPPPTP